MTAFGRAIFEASKATSKSGQTPYLILIVNIRKEVIQCLIVYRRRRRQPRPGISPRWGSASA